MTDADPVQTPALVDLDQLGQATEAWLQLTHPKTGAPLAAKVKIAGPEHPARKGAIWARQRARRAEVARTGEIRPTDPADDEADQLEVLVACTLDWQGIGRAGTPVAFSAAVCREVYGAPQWAWLRSQVQIGLDRVDLFFGDSGAA